MTCIHLHVDSCNLATCLIYSEYAGCDMDCPDYEEPMEPEPDITVLADMGRTRD